VSGSLRGFRKVLRGALYEQIKFFSQKIAMRVRTAEQNMYLWEMKRVCYSKTWKRCKLHHNRLTLQGSSQGCDDHPGIWEKDQLVLGYIREAVQSHRKHRIRDLPLVGGQRMFTLIDPDVMRT